MKQLLQKFIFLMIALLFANFSVVAAQSADNVPVGSENFAIILHSTYTITATGRTLVEQKFLITNKSPELFVNKYGIVVSSTNLENIKVTHNGQELTPTVEKAPGQTSISVNFTDKIVGEGKSNELLISYTDQDIALISGKILEVNIPKLSDHYQYQNYQLELKVPSIFETPSRISPSNFVLKQEGDYNIITYNDLQDQSVSAIFGNQQIFELKLNYYLNNPSSQNALTQITLPPETPYQKVYYINLDPMPNDLKEDEDGNFIATYEIPANNSFNVELFAQIKLNLHEDTNIPFSAVFPAQLAAQKFWEVDDPQIIAIANNLTDAKSIYDYTVKELNYSSQPLSQTLERLGALKALQAANKNNATCQEFTDVFVTLARQKNIPARRIVGIAYSSNEELRPSNLSNDVLHTWPEYYDQAQQAWLRSDPTWEDTTGGIDYFNNFDLNHIALAINGLSSTLPYSAGSYSGSSDEKNKKIYLDFSQAEFANINPEFAVNLIPRELYGVNLPGNYDLQVLNKTGAVWYFADIQIDSLDQNVVIEQNQSVQRILPFAKLTLPITVYNRNNSLNYKTKITVTTTLKDGQFTTNEFEVSTNPQLKVADPKKIITLGSEFIFFAIVTGSLFFFGRRFTHSLRRQGQKLEEESHKLQAISTSLKENQKNDGASPQSGVPDPRQ